MNGLPVDVEKIIARLQQLPGGAVLWELAMTQVALSEALEKLNDAEKANAVSPNNDGRVAVVDNPNHAGLEELHSVGGIHESVR